eukprot:m.186595 g.186595  ORF g.186595 m.186595 type:complete len:67 (+) comp18141_c1_seq1:98-298(+)
MPTPTKAERRSSALTYRATAHPFLECRQPTSSRSAGAPHRWQCPELCLSCSLRCSSFLFVSDLDWT